MTAPTTDHGSAWLVFYDSECGFCRWSLALLLRLDRNRRLVPRRLTSPRADESLSDLTDEQRMASWHLVAPDGHRWSGGLALAPVLRLLPGGGVFAAALDRVPALAQRGYDWVAAHRSTLGRLVPAKAKRRANEVIDRHAGRPG
jgi:predicted DCC family thiol-disulfide oxidoreductase YuxK